MVNAEILHMGQDEFDSSFARLTGHAPFIWQRRLFMDWFRHGRVPQALDLPTGLGKTSVMAIWHVARKARARLPRRLVYVVDRRAVVDQATCEAEKLADQDLRVSTLRGQYADNREWLEDPAAAAIVVGTVDMIGSRLLFSGYGVSRGMRPYHAGLLGADTLVVLDESHLVPPFERLLRAVEDGRRDGDGGHNLAAANETDQALVPNFQLLCLSATGRAEADRDVFQLDPADREDHVVQRRLDARKTLTLREIDGVAKPKDLAQALAEEAWALSDDGARSGAYLVYCNSRDVAEKTKAALDELAAKNKAPDIKIETELFVGARRVCERTEAETRLEALGFLAEKTDAGQRRPVAFLIATSAGEVGIDLDADHMICDLVAFERLVQRFGRVNRRGNKVAEIRLVVAEEPQPAQKEKQKIDTWKARKAARKLLTELPPVTGCNNDPGFDVSPGALLDLKQRAHDDACLARQIKEATTPEPLYPALTRPLVDAWSMTALEAHSGRPEVGPWLRGWVDDDPRTGVVWRTHLPVRTSGEAVTESECAAFFRAAPPHLTERLETETYRVADWLLARANNAKADLTDDAGEAEDATPLPPLDKKAVVAFVLDNRGAVSGSWRLDDLKSMKKDDVRKELIGRTLVVDARLGGLSRDGLLDKKHNDSPVTADSGNPWLDGLDPGFQVQRSTNERPPPGRTAHSFVARRSEEGEAREFLHVQTRVNETNRSVAAKAQHLTEHHVWTADKACKLATSLGLPDDYRCVLVLAARLHDEGKRAERWQRAANAPDSDDFYAKTKGPFRPNELNGYRHEFGSLPYIEADAEFAALSPEMQDLTLHLVAAHHGRARPVIPTQGCDDAPPTALRDRARDVAIRFARLQERWGPWGLAWFETLLRAADQQASRDLDEGSAPDG